MVMLLGEVVVMEAKWLCMSMRRRAVVIFTPGVEISFGFAV